ncbi:carbohydrate sulfotransferase 8-like isoform X1 [Paramormyrops kingsleyae]|uniref:carbohydrate sulfotransferase 8-like isoform X1 n=1 Tax=Paramormyrops kingsleyae TaxID=1676925 RepID=UPI003B97889F
MQRSLLQDGPDMLWVERRGVEMRCGRRRLRLAAMKLPCSFWFLLLFGAGGLVLFIHLQDLSEMVQQQVPAGVKLSPKEVSRKDLCADHRDELRREPGPDQRSNSEHSRSPSSAQGLDLSSARVTKGHRKLLLKSAPQEVARGTWGRLLQVQESRKDLMRHVCGRYRGRSARTITPQHVSRIYVEDRHKLLYCEVPKVGCSNWKRVLMVLQGLAPSTQEIQHDAVHYGNHLRRLDSFDHRGIAQRLETYTKVLFVREPLERLVSAFRDKFENPNTYYHPVFGRPIISRYRANASKEALKTGTGVTFKEFVQYLLDVHRPVGMDIHWEPVGRLCSPCLLDYDFIGKFETIEEDANFLLSRLGAPPNLTFPSFKDRNPNAERTSAHITQQYFTKLNASERQRAYDFYYMDYLMFNYSKPFKDLY